MLERGKHRIPTALVLQSSCSSSSLLPQQEAATHFHVLVAQVGLQGGGVSLCCCCSLPEPISYPLLQGGFFRKETVAHPRLPCSGQTAILFLLTTPLGLGLYREFVRWVSLSFPRLGAYSGQGGA